MRPDIPKSRATQKSGAKDQQKDLEAPQQLRADSKQGHRREESGQDRVRRRSGEDDTNPTRH
jgi:hypothetical protein